MHVCFCCVCFSFSVLSQEIGWEERLRNDLFLCLVGCKTSALSFIKLFNISKSKHTLSTHYKIQSKLSSKLYRTDVGGHQTYFVDS